MRDDEPAFPRPGFYNDEGSYDNPPQEGMSLRDWFAGQALTGILAGRYTAHQDGGVLDDDLIDLPEQVAGLAYQHADAMLAERRKGAR